MFYKHSFVRDIVKRTGVLVLIHVILIRLQKQNTPKITLLLSFMYIFYST